MNIYLVGFMGSGKSTVGKQLAIQLNRQFVDLDDWIEEQEGTTILDIFATKGEQYFRRLEQDAIVHFTSTDTYVVATGGGTPCQGDNMDTIIKNGISVYLKTSINILAGHLSGEKAHRPLIAHMKDKDLRKFIGDKLKERSPYYMQAQIRVRCNTSIELVIERIVNRLKEFKGIERFLFNEDKLLNDNVLNNNLLNDNLLKGKIKNQLKGGN